MLRKYFIAGNWKMNNSISQTNHLLDDIKSNFNTNNKCDVLVAPPFLSLQSAVEKSKSAHILVAAQNLHWEESGAFTGEVSATMLKEIDVHYVIIGHSERRQYFAETDKTVILRTKKALESGIAPIICVGETLQEREANQTLDVVKKQIETVTSELTDHYLKQCIFAYEPVWAIGTGKTATSEQAQEVHAYIRSILPSSVCSDVRIIYGGSMKPENAKELLLQKDIDGGLIGGASLNAEQFCRIIDIANELSSNNQ